MSLEAPSVMRSEANTRETENEDSEKVANETPDGSDLNSPPSKRLKQLRLPFAQIVQQQQVSSNSSPQLKRKHSACKETLAKFSCIGSEGTAKADENVLEQVSSSTQIEENERSEKDNEVEMETENKESSLQNLSTSFTAEDECPVGETSKCDDNEAMEVSLLIEDDDDDDDDDLNTTLNNSSYSIEGDGKDNLESGSSQSGKDKPVKKRQRLSKEERDLMKQKKEQEREQKRLAAEQKRLEKEKIKEELRLKKQQKQNEALAKKQEEEKKKEEKRLLKEEKKRKKEEELQLKQKLIEAKQEEKRQKELEKSLLEKQKLKKSEKVKAAFVGFFVKKDINITSHDEPSVFKSFEVKENMRLAPAFRSIITTEALKILDNCLKNQAMDLPNYLTDMRNKCYVPRKSPRTWPVNEDCQIMYEEPNQPIKKFPRAKLLKFHENVRPPYWGTWRKWSAVISPRNPLRKDEVYFDYDVESDDEWEEEEPGESLSGTEDEVEKSDGEYEVDNEFFVPHGYLSNEENDDDDEELSPDAQKLKLKLKEKEFLKSRKEKCQHIKPKLIGLTYISNVKPGDEELLKFFENYQAVILNTNTPIEVLKTALVQPEIANAEDYILSQNMPTMSTPKNTPRSVPEEAMPFLIKLFHGNMNKRELLINEFLEFWNQRMSLESWVGGENKPVTSTPTTKKGKTVSKRQLQITLNSIVSRDFWPHADYAKFGKMWTVNKETLEKYFLTDLSLPNKWEYVSKNQDEVKVIKPEDLLDNTVSVPITPQPKSANVLKMLHKHKERHKKNDELPKPLKDDFSVKDAEIANINPSVQSIPQSNQATTLKSQKMTLDKFWSKKAANVATNNNQHTETNKTTCDDVIVLDDEKVE